MAKQNTIESKVNEIFVLKQKIRDALEYCDSFETQPGDPLDLQRHIEHRDALLNLSYLTQELNSRIGSGKSAKQGYSNNEIFSTYFSR